MEQTKPKIGLVRIIVALSISALFLAIVIPNTGKIVIDRSTIPPTFTITERPQQIARLVAMLVVPLICVFAGARRFWFLEFVGWFSLLGLFILATQK